MATRDEVKSSVATAGEFLKTEKGALDLFCNLWPFARRILDFLKSIPGLDPKVKEALEIAEEFGNALYAGNCKSRGLAPERPEWQIHLDWAITDTGAWEPQCWGKVVQVYPECVIPGTGRKCVMQKAINAAKANNCNHAFEMSLLCQCHNPEAQQTIGNAGQQAVCDYLKTK